MKKRILIAFLAAGLLLSVSTQAANLNQAAATLPRNDEWALMALASLGQNAGSEYLKSPISRGSATDYEKRILALAAQGRDPRRYGQEDFLAGLLKHFDGTQMGDPSLLNDDVFGILSLKAAGETGILPKLRGYLLSHQNPDGGWSFARGAASDTNTTAMALAALKSTGSVPANGVSYLKSAQNPDGGFGFTKNSGSDGASTAWAIIGLRSAGQAVPGSATKYLESLQLGNGSFRWRPNDSSGSTLVTAYAVIALSGKSMPIKTVSAGNPAPIPAPAPEPDPNPQPAPNPFPKPQPSPGPAAVNGSQCVSISAPVEVKPSQQFFATITVKNTGSKTWTSDGTPHRLGSQNPQDTLRWQAARISLPQATAPDQPVTFAVQATAPAAAGTYPFAWQMLEENIQWFGQICSAQIQVRDSASQPVPANPQTNTSSEKPVPAIQSASTSRHDLTISYPGNIIYAGSVEAATPLEALIDAADEINLLYELQQTASGAFVKTVNGYAPDGAAGWQYAVNGSVPDLPAGDYQLKSGDRIQWYYGLPNAKPY